MGPPLDSQRQHEATICSAPPIDWTAPSRARALARRALDAGRPGLLEELSGGRRLIREALPSDVAPLAAAMRPADVAEAEGLDGHTPSEALWQGLALSLAPLAVEVDGEAAAMFGAVPQGEQPWSFAVVWMLGTPAVTADARWFLVASRAALADLARPFGRVGCVVSCSYGASLRWLDALGFWAPEGGGQTGYTGLHYRWLLWQHPMVVS